MLPWVVILAQGSSQAEVSITLRPQARVPGYEIRLGDIAEIRGDTQQVASLSSLVLGLSPIGDVDRILTQTDVRKALKKGGYSTDPAVTLDGPESVRVRALTVALNPEWVADSIRLALSKEYPESQFRLKTLKVVIPGRVLIPPDGTALQPDFQNWRGKADQMIPIHLYRKGRKFRSVPVRVEMSWEGQAPVAKRELPAGHLIGDQDIHWETKIHQGFPFDLALEPKSLGGMRMRLPVRGGDLVRNSALLPEQLIAKGELVEVTVRGNGFSVQTTALAEQPGVAGQKIRLLQTNTKRNMVGKVIGRQKVEILL